MRALTIRLNFLSARSAVASMALAVVFGLTQFNSPQAAEKPADHKSKHANWNLQCSACTEEFEERLSGCWLYPEEGDLFLFSSRNDVRKSGYVIWYPSLPEGLREAKGSITITTDGKEVGTVPEDQVTIADLDGSIFMEADQYEAFVAAAIRGNNATINFKGSGETPSAKQTISLKGFTAAIRAAEKQSPRYPGRPICE